MTSLHITSICVVGAGPVGKALCNGWRRAGREVLLAVRTPKAADEYDIATAMRAAGVIVLAVPFSAVDDLIGVADSWAGKIVLDCTNPLGRTDGRLTLTCGFNTSGGEQIAAKLRGARVVKTLNQTGAENIQSARSYPRAPAMFLAGDDAEALEIAGTLVSDLGFEAIQAGPLVNSRLLESLAMLWIDQAMMRGEGRDFAFIRERQPGKQESRE